MSKEVIPHEITDWSKISENAGFWGRIDLLRPDINFGIHRYNDAIWTSGMVGVGRVFDKDNNPVQDDGKEHILIIRSSYELDPWKMLETVMLDDEYDSYLSELSEDNRFLFTVFYEQPLIKLPRDINTNAEILFALSYINACYSLCKKGLKKSLIYHSDNFSAKVRGKIDVTKNIKQNTSRGRTDRFYCKYIDFTEDTTENRIIKRTLIMTDTVLKQRFREDIVVRGKISYCLNCLRHVKTVDITKGDFNNSDIGGLYSYYRPVLQLAKALNTLFRRGYSSEGNKKEYYTIPYVINMETLFEYYARAELKMALKSTVYSVEKYSEKLYLQKDVEKSDEMEKGIHLMPFCIPDIIIYKNGIPFIVIDAKYKMDSRPNRADSHQLLAYVLLTGATRCGFILPGKRTKVKEMVTSGDNYLPLAPPRLRYYELLLGNIEDGNELQKVLE